MAYISNSHPARPIYIFQSNNSIYTWPLIFLKHLSVSNSPYLPHILYSQRRSLWKLVFSNRPQSLYLWIFFSKLSSDGFYLILRSCRINIMCTSSKLSKEKFTLRTFWFRCTQFYNVANSANSGILGSYSYSTILGLSSLGLNTPLGTISRLEVMRTSWALR